MFGLLFLAVSVASAVSAPPVAPAAQCHPDPSPVAVPPVPPQVAAGIGAAADAAMEQIKQADENRRRQQQNTLP